MPILNKNKPLAVNDSKVTHHCIINQETGCQYMFKPYGILPSGKASSIKVHIDDGHGWRTYDNTQVAGNYDVSHARTFWNSLIKNGFTTNYEN